MRKAALVLIAALIASPALAQDKQGAFSCTTRDKFADVSSSSQRLRVNNFSINERDSLMGKGRRVIEVSFSAANRQADPVYFSAQFIGYDDAGPILAISVNPDFDMVRGNTTTTAKGDSYVTPGTLAKVKTLCLQLIGDL